MKKHILSLMAAVSLLTGCYDLDRTPYDQVSSEAMWQTADQCKQGLMGVYASLKEDDLFGKMSTLMWLPVMINTKYYSWGPLLQKLVL